MSKKDFIEAMGHVDDRILERYAQEEDRLNAKRPGEMWVRWTAAAACLAVIVGLLVLQKPDVPVYEDAIYSAQEIADLFGAKNYNDGVATNAYTTVCAPAAEYLNLHAIPSEEYLPLYQHHPSDTALNKSQFQAMIEHILPRFSSALGEAAAEYEINQRENSYRNELHALINFENYNLNLSQNSFSNYLSLYVPSQSDDPLQRIFINGEAIQVDQRLTDEEILLSLTETKRELFDIFGVSFSDAKVVRSYNEYSKYGATWINVYFYNEADHSLNATTSVPKSDYIAIEFDNHAHYKDDIESNSVLCNCTIRYFQCRTDATKVYQQTALAKLIPLEDAEAFLYNGYVFGGHSCPLCMAAQEKVDFTGYDYVGLEYVFGRDNATGEPTTGIPFYAFYKQIGTTENGNLIFAKTYVPAIEVSGYEEYFQSQIKDHNS